MTIIAIITTSSVPFIINHLLVDSSSKGQLLTARLLGVAMVMIIIKRDNIYRVFFLLIRPKMTKCQTLRKL